MNKDLGTTTSSTLSNQPTGDQSVPTLMDSFCAFKSDSERQLTERSKPTRDSNEASFSIPEIPLWLDESAYIKARDLISEAGSLAGDGAGGDLGINAEYERGMAELILRCMGWSGDLTQNVISAIHGYAREVSRRPPARAQGGAA